MAGRQIYQQWLTTRRAAGRGQSASHRWLSDSRLGLVVALVFLFICGLSVSHIVNQLDPVTGDEPFYLVTAGSILRDRDIDETNNWFEGLDEATLEYRRDVDDWLPPEPLPPSWQGWPTPARHFPPHASQTIRSGLYSKHGLGVPLLIVPALATGGGRLAVVAVFGLIGALVAVNVFLLAREQRASQVAALTITAALMLTNPLLSYSFLIFPELPAALLTIYAFRRLLAPRNNLWQALLVGLAIAALPWFHARLALIAVALGLMALVRLRRDRRGLVWLPVLTLISLSASALTAFYIYFYGRPWPNTQDHAGLVATAIGWGRGLIGLLLDQQWGLLIHAPVYLLVVAGSLALARSRPDYLGWLFWVVLPYYLLIGAYNQWWGEWCPPARYLTTLVPLAAAPLAALWAQDRTPITGALVGLLSLPGWAIMLTFLTQPRLMYNHPTGHSVLLMRISEAARLDLVAATPSFVVPTTGTELVQLWWGAGTLILALLITLATFEKRSTGDQASPTGVATDR